MLSAFTGQTKGSYPLTSSKVLIGWNAKDNLSVLASWKMDFMRDEYSFRHLEPGNLGAIDCDFSRYLLRQEKRRAS